MTQICRKAKLRTKSRSGLTILLLASLLFVLAIPSWGQTITEFEAPGSGTAKTQGTQTANINKAETIVGTYADSSGVNHGFERTVGGTFTTIDVTGAGTLIGQGTLAVSINTAGTI